MKNSFGIGTIVVALIATILALLGILSLVGAIAVFLFMFGAWSVVSGLILVGRKDLYYYVGWGLVLVSLSTAYLIPLQYSIAVALILIIVIIFVSRLKPGSSQTVSVDSLARFDDVFRVLLIIVPILITGIYSVFKINDDPFFIAVLAFYLLVIYGWSMIHMFPDISVKYKVLGFGYLNGVVAALTAIIVTQQNQSTITSWTLGIAGLVVIIVFSSFVVAKLKIDGLITIKVLVMYIILMFVTTILLFSYYYVTL